MGDSFPPVHIRDLLFNEDTIVAVATPPGQGAIGMVRLSGSRAGELVEGILVPGGKPDRRLSPRRMTYRWLRDGEDLIDEAQVCFFPGPRSYTGEDVAEIYVHGSPAVMRRLLAALVARGARIAEPGEFTFRAFRCGRIDLARAESVNELVRAENEVARRLALRALRGGLAEALSAVRDNLDSMLAAVETELEFDADDTGADSTKEIGERLEACRDSLSRLVEAGRRQELRRRGAVVVIAGKPNVGKSTLLNGILGRERAIVSPIPGTTRDTIEEAVEFQGIPIVLVDTAGVLGAASGVDRLGVERSLRALSEADGVLFLADLSGGLDSRDHDILQRIREPESPAPPFLVAAANKSDLIPGDRLPPLLESMRSELGLSELPAISARTGDNVDHVLGRVAESVRRDEVLTGPADLAVTARQRDVMAECLQLLSEIALPGESAVTLDVTADRLHRVRRLVSQLTGQKCESDILDTVFARFCIGK